MHKLLVSIFVVFGISFLIPNHSLGQTYDPTNVDMLNPDNIGRDKKDRYGWNRDSTHTKKVDIPEGFFQWTIDELFGDITPQVSDTLMFGFQKFNNTDGPTGQYSHLGNVGSPRLSRIFFNRHSVGDPFMIANGYDFLRPKVSSFRFWNTKSPITNLSYHSGSSGDTGEDRVRANFATNIDKQSGIGFLIDYTYAHGYYANQGNSCFSTSLYGYHIGDRYQMHALINLNHIKTSENGGIENDLYIIDPKQFSRSFTSNTIPTNLNSNWNRNDDQTYFLTHRYNFGFYQDAPLPDTLNVDSIMKADSLWTIPQEFVTAASIIHTASIKRYDHTHFSHREPENYYSHTLYWKLGETKDIQLNTQVRNTIGLSMREGFKKWVKFGMTAFVTHDLNLYTIPDYPNPKNNERRYLDFTESDIYIGGNIARKSGNLLHFDATGKLAVLGDNIGNFDVDGNISLEFPFLRDTCQLVARAYVKNEKPNFYWRHWHSKHAWWDKELANEFRPRIEGTLNIKRTRTRLTVGWENVTNYTYLATTFEPTKAKNVFSRSYDIKQASSSVQVLMASLNQDFELGVLHWDNEVVWQQSSNARVLPLPALSLYSNLYLRFRVFKILRVEVGADLRMWTKYYAPDYAPALNQFTTQDPSNHIKIGGYPIINAYANIQMKRIRIYVCGNHVNSSSNNAFYAPHYPVNPLCIRFGLSWNFIN